MNTRLNLMEEGASLLLLIKSTKGGMFGSRRFSDVAECERSMLSIGMLENAMVCLRDSGRAYAIVKNQVSKSSGNLS